MLMSATVAPLSPIGELPQAWPADLIDRLALAAEGLDVRDRSAFGVLVRATGEAFERALGVRLSGSLPCSVIAHPVSRVLKGLAGRVDVSASGVPLDHGDGSTPVDGCPTGRESSDPPPGSTFC